MTFFVSSCVHEINFASPINASFITVRMLYVYVFRFDDYYVNRVKQLIYTFPENATTSTGALFWSAPKRFPKPLEFNSSDHSCISFIISAAILRAETYDIDIPSWASNSKKIADIIDKIELPQFRPKQGVKIVTDEKATSLTASSSDDSTVIEQLIKVLDDGACSLPLGFRMNPIQFEKVCLVF